MGAMGVIDVIALAMDKLWLDYTPNVMVACACGATECGLWMRSSMGSGCDRVWHARHDQVGS